jgi:putative copper resistance protein D
MSSFQSSVPVTASTQLLDKYMLPKVALTVITIASFIGVWLTMSTHGAGTWLQVGSRWLHLVSFAALAGGYMWKGLFASPAEKPAQQPYFAQFTAASFARFRRVAQIALPVFLLTAVYDLFRFADWGVSGLLTAEMVLLALLALTGSVDAYGQQPENPFAARRLARLILLLLMLDALVQAGFDVTLTQGGQMWPLLVRWLHLAAFGLWFGGAVWNIFITVPAARSTISLPVVVAASQQLERFRIAVRIILPTLIITGLIQAYRYVGFNIYALTASPIGWLILTKLLLIGVLIVVFLTCPMWRACSPISGMCKLDDLYAQEHN